MQVKAIAFDWEHTVMDENPDKEHRGADETPCETSPAYTIQTLYELPGLLRRLRVRR